MKKPTKAQLEILKQLNEDICILNCKWGSLEIWTRIYDYKNSKGIGGSMKKKTLEMLIFNEWVKTDYSKNIQIDGKYFYFITEKGKAAAHGKA